METVDYLSETLIGGETKTQQVKFAADTYYNGMPLQYDATNDRYLTLTTGDIAGIFLEKDERIMVNNDIGSIIIGGEVMETGLVTATNTALTVTDDMIAAWAALGFYIKKV